MDSVKLTTDPRQQTTLTQAYGDPTKVRPTIRTRLLHYAKNWNLYKQVRYLPTREKPTAIYNKKKQQKVRPTAISKPPPKEMPQISTDVNDMLSDENAELGPMTQTQTQGDNDNLIDTPSSTQGSTVEAEVVVEKATNRKADTSVLVDANTAREVASEQSEILITESQLPNSPNISAVGESNKNDTAKETGESTLGTKNPTLPEQAAQWAMGHDDPEVVVIDQECLDAFLKDQHDYATTMDDRAKALLASNLSETQVKLRQFYGMEDEFGNEVITPEVEKKLREGEYPSMRH